MATSCAVDTLLEGCVDQGLHAYRMLQDSLALPTPCHPQSAVMLHIHTIQPEYARRRSHPSSINKGKAL